MKKFLASVLIIGASFVYLSLPVKAYYFQSYHFIIGEWATNHWVFFNGCDKETCMDDMSGDTYFDLGDYNIKQGVYALGGPGQVDTKSKLVLTYSYRLVTDEDADSTADYGIVKLKNVDTEEIYYYKEIYPNKAKNKWTKVRKVLPADISAERLQLVFEVYNDTDRLTVFKVNNVIFYHRSKPMISGTVYQTASEKKFAVEGAEVQLKRRNKKKTLQVTTTDEYGNFSFFPVKQMRKFKVIAVEGGQRTRVNIPKLKMGSHHSRVELNLE